MSTANAGDVVFGSVLVNNDPRVPVEKRNVVVAGVAKDPQDGEWYAYYASRKRKARIKFSRIFTDGRQRNQGYNLNSKVTGAAV